METRALKVIITAFTIIVFSNAFGVKSINSEKISSFLNDGPSLEESLIFLKKASDSDLANEDLVDILVHTIKRQIVEVNYSSKSKASPFYSPNYLKAIQRILGDDRATDLLLERLIVQKDAYLIFLSTIFSYDYFIYDNMNVTKFYSWNSYYLAFYLNKSRKDKLPSNIKDFLDNFYGGWASFYKKASTKELKAHSTGLLASFMYVWPSVKRKWELSDDSLYKNLEYAFRNHIFIEDSFSKQFKALKSDMPREIKVSSFPVRKAKSCLSYVKSFAK